MQYRRLAALALVAALAACGSDGDDTPPVATPDQLSLTIVSGDGQVAPVADAGTVPVAAISPAQTIPDNILPEPLVARILVDGAPPSAAVSAGDPFGPSFAALPSDIDVTFRVIQPEGVGNRHCGASFLDAARPDSVGEVTTFWERGTYAGECRMEVRLVVDGLPRVDTVFTATFEPGELAAIYMGVPEYPDNIVTVGDTLDGRAFIRQGVDTYGNTIAASEVTTLPDTVVRWQWTNNVNKVQADTIRGVGWQILVPDFEAVGYPPFCEPTDVGKSCHYSARFRAWVAGIALPIAIVFRTPSVAIID